MVRLGSVPGKHCTKGQSHRVPDLVGSRTFAILRRFSLSVAPRFLWVGIEPGRASLAAEASAAASKILSHTNSSRSSFLTTRGLDRNRIITRMINSIVEQRHGRACP